MDITHLLFGTYLIVYLEFKFNYLTFVFAASGNSMWG